MLGRPSPIYRRRQEITSGGASEETIDFPLERTAEYELYLAKGDDETTNFVELDIAILVEETSGIERLYSIAVGVNVPNGFVMFNGPLRIRGKAIRFTFRDSASGDKLSALVMYRKL